MDNLIFSLGNNEDLARRISDQAGVPLGNVECKTFSDGEQRIRFLEDLRGKKIFIVQSTQPPAENLVRLLLAIDAARDASAKEITAVIPYFGYARQERKLKSGEPISARAVAILLESVGVNRVLTMDIHADVIGGFFRTANVEFLYAYPVLTSFFKELFKDTIAADELVIVSPDIGGVARAQNYAKRIMRSADFAIIHKERNAPNEVACMKLVGDVRGKVALIIDDIIDTCGTLSRAASLLTENGARKVYAAATHGVFSGNAIANIDNSVIEQVFVTDTIFQEGKMSPKVQTISVDKLFGDAVMYINNGRSLSALF